MCSMIAIDRDEGLGTTYERVILHKIFDKINETYGIRSIVEAPCFGMTGMPGINSIWWAMKGVQVTVVDDNARRVETVRQLWDETGFQAKVEFQSRDMLLMKYGDEQFDMSWNFASLWYVTNIGQFFKEMVRITRKVIFICVPNRTNIGYWLRQASIKQQGLNSENIEPARIINEMKKLNWKLVEKGYFDVPPWPDIAMKKEEFCEKIGLKWLANIFQKRDANGICILDYYSGRKQSMEEEILRYSFLENSPQLFKRIWAHHQYFIFIPNVL